MGKDKIDPRFARVVQDPRFKRVPKNERKVKIDSRFSKMFTDERFHTKAAVDKRGRNINQIEKEDLKKFYDIEDSDNDKEEQVEKHTNDEITESDSKGKSKKTKDKKDKFEKKKNNLKRLRSDDDESEDGNAPDFTDIRGKGLGNDISDDSDEEDEIADFDDLEEGIIHGWGELDEDAKRIENAETARLAVCNCDWDRISANDLFVTFNSFKPTGGGIKSVKIYLSDFGEERMAEEEATDPKELKEMAGNQSEDDEGNGEENIEGSKYHMEKLRQYQLNRMKYYYAVVECSDKDTADKIYEQCDGMDYELSGTRLDLRFVPNDMVFDRQPKSEVKELPNIKTYQPASFLNTALQQSTVRLTWDESDPKRLENTMRKFTKEDLENMDFRDYIASSSDDEEEKHSKVSKSKNKTDGDAKGASESEDDTDKDEENERIKKYRQLMEEINSKERKEKEEENSGMEVTWSMENKSNSKDVTSDNEAEEGSQDGVSTDDEAINNPPDEGGKDGEDNDGFNDPFFSEPAETAEKSTEGTTSLTKKKKKKSKKRKEELTEEEQKQKDELELLLVGEDDKKEHFSLKGILEQEKTSKKNNKRKKRKLKEDKPEDDFVFNTKDERFNALYDSHLYSLDPSEPNYKKTKATEAIIDEAQKRREGRAKERTQNVKYNTNNNIETKQTQSINKVSLSALVKSVKSKTQNHQTQKEKRKLR